MRYVKAKDGTRIAVYDYNPGGKKTVFLVHGWPLSHKMYEYQIELLTQCGCRVVAVDLRGFGAADTPASGYSYNTMASDLHCVVQALNLSRFTLVGFSMGGAIALRYMGRYKGQGVKRLILLAAAAPSWVRRPGFPYGLSREAVDNLIQLARTDRPQLAYQFSHTQLFASPQSEAAKDWFEDIALSASGLGTVQAAISLRDEDVCADLKAVHVPAVIIHGAKDSVVSSDLALAQHQGIPGSRLYTLENSGHGITYDELERFNALFLCALEESRFPGF